MANEALIQRIREHIVQLPDAEVLKYLNGTPGDYDPSAVELARAEAVRRGLAIPSPAVSATAAARAQAARQWRFYHQAARASFWAPILALGVSMFTSSPRDTDRAVAMVIGVINGLIILGGLALAVVALLGMRKVGRREILGYGLAGLIINGLVVVSIVYTWMMVRDLRHRLDAQKQSPAGDVRR